MRGREATIHLLKIRLFHENPSWEHTVTPGGSIVSHNPAAPAIQRRLEQRRMARLLSDMGEAALAGVA